MISKIVKIRFLFLFIETFNGYSDVIINEVPILTNQIMVGSGVRAYSESSASSISGACSEAGASGGSGTFIFLK
jgi:hypothetical protein